MTVPPAKVIESNIIKSKDKYEESKSCKPFEKLRRENKEQLKLVNDLLSYSVEMLLDVSRDR